MYITKSSVVDEPEDSSYDSQQSSQNQAFTHTPLPKFSTTSMSAVELVTPDQVRGRPL